MYNTPPVFPIYVSMLTLRWIKAQGLATVGANNARKAALLYAAVDNSQIFSGTVAIEDRSLMNVNFVAATPEIEQAFLAKAKATGMNGLAGHRSVGGFRASIYNALPLESVEFLVAQMQDFERSL